MLQPRWRRRRPRLPERNAPGPWRQRWRLWPRPGPRVCPGRECSGDSPPAGWIRTKRRRPRREEAVKNRERERGASRLGTMAGLIKKQILKHLSRLEPRAWAQARLRPRVPEATRGFWGGGDWQPSRRRPLDSLLQRGRGRAPWSPLAPALRAGLASQRLMGSSPVGVAHKQVRLWTASLDGFSPPIGSRRSV